MNMAKNDIRLYTFVDEETLRLFNSARIKEGIPSYSEYLRLVLQRYLHEEPETNKLISRDRVSQNYMTLYTEVVNDAREAKLLMTTMMIMIGCLAKDSNRVLSKERVSKILHEVVSVVDDDNLIDSGVIEKVVNGIFDEEINRKED